MTKETDKLLNFIFTTETGRRRPDCFEVIFAHAERHLPKPLTSMTIDEVIKQGNWRYKRFGSSAAGAAQFMKATLQGFKTQGVVSGRELFNAHMQIKLATLLLERRGLKKYLAGRMSLTTFGNNLAKEWASFPVLSDVKGAHRYLKRGETYYAGDKLNKALVSPALVEELLKSLKAQKKPSKVTKVVTEKPKTLWAWLKKTWG